MRLAQFGALFLVLVSTATFAASCPKLLASENSPHMRSLPPEIAASGSYVSFTREDRRYFWTTQLRGYPGPITLPLYFKTSKQGALSVFIGLRKEEDVDLVFSSLVGRALTFAPVIEAKKWSHQDWPIDVALALNAGEKTTVLEIKGVQGDLGGFILQGLLDCGLLFETIRVAHSGTSSLGNLADPRPSVDWEWLTRPERVLFWNVVQKENETVPVLLRGDGSMHQIYLPAIDEKDAANTHAFVSTSKQRSLASRGESYFTYAPTSTFRYLPFSELPTDIQKLVPLGSGMVEIQSENRGLILDGMIGGLDTTFYGTTP